MPEKNLNELFVEQLKDIYFAEKQIYKTLPKMAKAAHSPELKKAFLTHREQTEHHIERLDKVFEIIGKPARGKTCEAIKGIIEEGEEVISDFENSAALDAGLIAAGQAVEHYEMARYGTLKVWADKLGMSEASKLLAETLQEEKQTDQLLSKMATSDINAKAA